MSSEITPPIGPAGYVWARCPNTRPGEEHFPCSRCEWIHAEDKAKRDAAERGTRVAPTPEV